jgi:hypothetical protein
VRTYAPGQDAKERCFLPERIGARIRLDVAGDGVLELLGSVMP